MNIIAILNHLGVFFKEEPIRQLQASLERKGFEVVYPVDVADLLKLIEKNPASAAPSSTGTNTPWACARRSRSQREAADLRLRQRPVHPGHSPDRPASERALLQYRLGMADDIALKMGQATQEYQDAILPPFTKALFKYVEEGKYTFCTPGHMGGTAFQMSPTGSIFYDFYGPNAFKADVSISMPELGSLLDHSGPHKEAEEYIARTFNADRSYIVTNGTSTANKIVGMYSAPVPAALCWWIATATSRSLT